MLNIILLMSKITHAETPLENLCYIFITIINNYPQIWPPNHKMSLVVSSTVEGLWTK